MLFLCPNLVGHPPVVRGARRLQTTLCFGMLKQDPATAGLVRQWGSSHRQALLSIAQGLLHLLLKEPHQVVRDLRPSNTNTSVRHLTFGTFQTPRPCTMNGVRLPYSLLTTPPIRSCIRRRDRVRRLSMALRPLGGLCRAPRRWPMPAHHAGLPLPQSGEPRWPRAMTRRARRRTKMRSLATSAEMACKLRKLRPGPALVPSRKPLLPRLHHQNRQQPSPHAPRARSRHQRSVQASRLAAAAARDVARGNEKLIA